MIPCSAGAGGGLLGKGQGVFPSGGAFLMEYPALRRFYKIAKGLLHRISLCGSPFPVRAPVCCSGLLLTAEML